MILRNLIAFVLLAALGSAAPKPPATRRDNVAVTIHGATITDPYRWLEDQDSPETRAWIKEQMAYTRPLLDAVSGRAAIARRLEQLMKVETVTVPQLKAGRYFYTRRAPRQDKAVICMRAGGKGSERILVDPNKMPGAVSVSIAAVSEDGKLLAYRQRKGGEDEVTIHLLNVDSGALLPDEFSYAPYHGFSIHPDGRSMYFSKIVKEGCRVFLHRFGQPASTDRLVFGDGYDPTWFTSCDVSRDGRWLTCRASRGSTGDDTEIFAADVAGGGQLKPIVNGMKARFSGGVGGDRLFLLTDWNAPNGRVLSIDLRHSERVNWKEIIPESGDAILNTELLGGHIAV